MVRHHKTLTDRQIEILYTLATKGEQTQSNLKDAFEITYPAVVGMMKILQDRELLKVARKEKGVGRKKVYYVLTDNGIEALSRDSRINLDKFWHIAFAVYDRKTNGDIKYPVRNYFLNYEKNILGFDPDYSSLSWSVVLKSFEKLYNTKNLSAEISVLYILGKEGPMSKEDLLSYKARRKDESLVTLSKNSDSIAKLISNKLVFEIKTDRGLQYRISILGFLLLMSYLDQNALKGSSKKKHHDDMALEIRQILKNCRTAVPHISRYWEKLRHIISELDVLQFFRFIANSYMPLSEPIQANGVKELIVSGRIMTELNGSSARKEAATGFRIFRTMFDGNHPNKEHSDVYGRLLLLGMLQGNAFRDQIKLYKPKNKNYDLEVEKAISNKVCFEFFTYFLDQVMRKKEFAEYGTTENPDVRKHYQLSVEKWNKFQKNNRKFRNWYHGWLEEIKKFEEKNLKVIKEKDFLTV